MNKPTYSLAVSSPNIDGITGYHSILAQIEEVDGDNTTLSPPEKFGIEFSELVLRFDGDPEKWLAKIGQEMLERHKARRGVHHKLLQLSGKKIPL